MPYALAWIAPLCGLIGIVVGALLGHKLARSRDTAAWARTQRLNEWREVLDAMTKAHNALLIYLGMSPLHICAISPDQEMHIETLRNEATEAFTKQVFIANDLSKSSIPQQWAIAVARYAKDQNGIAFTEEFKTMRDLIVAKATKL